MRQRLTDPARADWPFLQNGAVTLFWRKALFHDACRALAQLDYAVTIIDCTSETAYCEGMSEALRWQEQFGRQWNGNLDALNDGAGSMPFNDQGRAALAFEDFDGCVDRDRRRALIALDILARQARRHLLSGCLLLALVQTGKARFDSGPLGGAPAVWNQREWLTRSRG